MKKYVVLGVNENPKYLYYIPLVCWAWKKFNWEPYVYYCVKKPESFLLSPIESLVFGYQSSVLLEVNGFKSETVAQVSRLYASVELRGMLMTSDVDMLPLSDYWHPQPGEFTTYGRDLTDYHYPICYLAGMDFDWRDIMLLRDLEDPNVHIKRDLRTQKNMWTLDQDLITERLLVYQDQLVKVNRGTDQRTGYPIGRVDRSNWRLDHKVLIDAHLPHDVLTNEDSFRKVMELLHHVWPKEDFKWFVQYTKEFKKLL